MKLNEAVEKRLKGEELNSGKYKPSLVRLGVRVESAAACGSTNKGPWRSAKTPGIHEALSNAYLKSEGLYALRDGWIKLHYPE